MLTVLRTPIWLTLIVTLLMAVGGFPARGSDSQSSGNAAHDYLMTRMLEWIESRTEHDVQAVRRALPRVLLVPAGERIQTPRGTFLIHADIGGLWNSSSREIVLVKPWRASSLIDLSILLHELVHAVQSDSGERACSPDAEWEAYSLQIRWLAERDIMMFVDWNEVLEKASCDDAAHP